MLPQAFTTAKFPRAQHAVAKKAEITVLPGNCLDNTLRLMMMLLSRNGWNDDKGCPACWYYLMMAESWPTP